MNLFSNFAILFLILSCPRISRGADSDIEDNSPPMSAEDDAEVEDNAPEMSDGSDSETEDSPSQMPAGDSSKKGDPKYLVSIYYSRETRAKKYRCAGALVTMEIVVTTWNCVNGLKRKKMTVVAGSGKLRGKGHVRTVTRIIWPTKINPKRGRMDIAVLKVKTPFEKSPKIDSIELCNAPLTSKSEMLVSGWRGPNKSLLTGKVHVIPRNHCKPHFKDFKIRVKHSMICAGGTKDAYFGGTGAPGVVKERLCAIAVAKQEVKTLPHLYTDLSNSKVQKFVLSAMRDLKFQK